MGGQDIFADVLPKFWKDARAVLLADHIAKTNKHLRALETTCTVPCPGASTDGLSKRSTHTRTRAIRTAATPIGDGERR